MKQTAKARGVAVSQELELPPPRQGARRRRDSQQGGQRLGWNNCVFPADFLLPLFQGFLQELRRLEPQIMPHNH